MLWNLFIRTLALLQRNKCVLWKGMWTMTVAYFVFATYAILDEAVLNGLPVNTTDDFAHLCVAYPKFFFNALITSLLGIFSGDRQFPVAVCSAALIAYVYQLTIIKGK